jgi:hypothetical protein
VIYPFFEKLNINSKNRTMKRILFLCMNSVFLLGALNAQDTAKWTKQATFSLNASQVSLTNWAAGGNNSYSGNALVSMAAKYTKGRNIWENSLITAYGIQKQGDIGVIKTDDRIDLASQYGYRTTNHWYISALLNAKSQFYKGFNYPNDSVSISNFFAPGYIITSVGMDYKPSDNFSLFLSPVTGKTIIVNNQRLADMGAFGVDPAEYDANKVKIKDGKRVKQDFGAYLSASNKYKLMENITFETKLNLFSNYLKKPENIVVNWEALISAKVNKFISATLSTQYIYDDNIKINGVGPRSQFKEIFGVGFLYSL